MWLDMFFDQILMAFGSQTAKGRVQLHMVSKHIWNQWKQYAGRNRIKQPTLGNFRQFLTATLDVYFEDDEDVNLSDLIDLHVLIPRMANVLIDQGKISFD